MTHQTRRPLVLELTDMVVLVSLQERLIPMVILLILCPTFLGIFLISSHMRNTYCFFFNI